MRIARWMVPVVVGAVVTPLSIGLGALLLGTVDDSEAVGGDAPAPTGVELKAGDVGVPIGYAKLLRDAAAHCGEKLLTAPLLAAQLKQESNFNPRARSVAAGGSSGAADGEGSLTDPRADEPRSRPPVSRTGRPPVTAPVNYAAVDDEDDYPVTSQTARSRSRSPRPAFSYETGGPSQPAPERERGRRRQSSQAPSRRSGSRPVDMGTTSPTAPAPSKPHPSGSAAVGASRAGRPPAGPAADPSAWGTAFLRRRPHRARAGAQAQPPAPVQPAADHHRQRPAHLRPHQLRGVRMGR